MSEGSDAKEILINKIHFGNDIKPLKDVLPDPAFIPKKYIDRQKNYEVAESSVKRPVYSNEAPEVIDASWRNGFTDPLSHRDDHFRYVVYGFQGRAADVVQKMALIHEVKNGQAGVDIEHIDLLEQPRRISERTLISGSVIDQDHRQTFGETGLILSAPRENILDAFSEDAGTNYSHPENEISASSGLMCTVDDLMKDSKLYGKYNEVRIKGKTEAGQIKVTGVWIKVYEHGEPIDRQSAGQLMNFAKQDGLPVIKIQEKTIFPQEDQAPEVHVDPVTDAKGNASVMPYAFSVNRGGLRYWMNFGRGEFFIVNDKRQFNPMTPEQFAYAESLLESELDAEVKEQLKDVFEGLPDRYQQYHADHPSKPEEEDKGSEALSDNKFIEILRKELFAPGSKSLPGTKK